MAAILNVKLTTMRENTQKQTAQKLTLKWNKPASVQNKTSANKHEKTEQKAEAQASRTKT